MKLPVFAEYKNEFQAKIWREAAREICRRHKISFTGLRRETLGESVVFLVDDKFVIKIYIPHKNLLDREKTALETARTNINIPKVVAFGEIENYKYLVTTQLAGESLTREIWLKLKKPEQISILAALAEGLNNLHLSDASRINFDWHSFIEKQAANCFARQKSCQVNERVLAAIPAYIEENLKLLPTNFAPVFLHGDVHFGNLRVAKKNARWEISGLFDFADSLKGFVEYEFVAIGLLMIQGQGDLQREFFRLSGYADADINENLRKRLMLLSMFYEWSDLRRYALRLRPSAIEYSLDKLEKEIWNFC